MNRHCYNAGTQTLSVSELLLRHVVHRASLSLKQFFQKA
jgi:hypothetical protein